MARICIVCNQEIESWNTDWVRKNGKIIHSECLKTETSETHSKAQNTYQEQQHQQEEEKDLYKSVRIKGGVDINSFDMPFGDMVMFMVKWAIASIPAFIILFIIFGIFFAIFGALFF